MPTRPVPFLRPLRRGPIALLASAAAAVAAGGVALTQIALPANDSASLQSQVFVHDSSDVADQLALADRLANSHDWTKAADVLQEIIAKNADKLVPTSNEGSAPGVQRYMGAANAVHHRLASWPPEGVAAYRARYEPPADQLLDAAGDDPAALANVERLYFPTDAARAAALLTIDSDLASGRFSAAARVANDLLALHPMLGDQRAAILFRVALADHLAGDEAGARAAAGALHTQFPHAIGLLAGRDAVLSDALTGLLASPSPSAVSTDTSWPTIGGSPDHASASVATGTPGARLLSVALGQPTFSAGGDESQQRTLLEADAHSRSTGAGLGIMPSIDAGQLFFQDGRRLYAIDLASGEPLPGWLATYPAGGGNDASPTPSGIAGLPPPGRMAPLLRRGTQGPALSGTAPQPIAGAFSVPGWGWPRGRQLGVTIDGDAVFAVMGQPDDFSTGFGGIQREMPRLVSLDRATGRERWAASPQLGATAVDPTRHRPAPGAGAQPDSIDAVELCGTPLAVGDSVYVAGRSNKQVNFVDAYVLCYDRATGTMRWACYVAGSNADSSALIGSDMPNTGAGLGEPQLAVVGGQVYVATNLGAIAAIDAAQGTLDWLTTYHRDAALADPAMQLARIRARLNNYGNGIDFSQQSARPWTNNPPIVANGRIYALPSDGTDLLVCDANDGRLMATLPLNRLRAAPSADIATGFAPADGPDTLLAVHDGRILLQGMHREPRAPGESTEQPRPALADVWCVQPPSDDASGGWHVLFHRAVSGEPKGRGFIARDNLFLPTDERLYIVSISRAGRLVGNYPALYGYWPSFVAEGRRGNAEAEGPGNVVVAGDEVIVAGDRRVNAYAALPTAIARCDANTAAAPNDPTPRLQYAEMLFNAGNPAGAAAKLDDAIHMLGGPDAWSPGRPGRDAIFAKALSLARREGGTAGGRPGTEADAAAAFFDRAAQTAASPVEQVTYRLSRAAFEFDHANYPSAVRLYEEVLVEPARRAVSVREAGGMATAASVADREIARLIRTVGPPCYTAYELVAGEKFDAAAAAHDPAALQEVADAYPNSTVAPRALLAAASTYQAAGNVDAASRALRAAYARGSAGAAGETILQRLIAADLARADHMAVASGRLRAACITSANKSLAETITLPDGSALKAGTTYADAAKAVNSMLARADAAALPSFDLPDTARVNTVYRALRAARADVPPRPAAPPEPFVSKGAGDAIRNVSALITPDDLATTRNDRIVAWVEHAGFFAYAVGQATPALRVPVIEGPPLGVAWIGGSDRANLLAWTGQGMWLAKPGLQQPAWTFAIAALPPLGGLADGADAEEGEAVNDSSGTAVGVFAPPGAVINGRIFIRQAARGQQVVIVNGRPVLVNGRVFNGVQQGDASGRAVEQIDAVRVTPSHVIVATSAGRVIALDPTDGHMQWQGRPADHGFTRVLASEDFVVLQIDAGWSDGNGNIAQQGLRPQGVNAGPAASSQLLVLDAYGGQAIGCHRFGITTGNGGALVNAALSPDGLLVYTTPDQIFVRDLYVPFDQVLATRVLDAGTGGNEGVYSNAICADQLLIADNSVLAVATSPPGVWAMPLSSPIPTLPAPTGESSVSRAILLTEDADNSLSLRAVGGKLFVTSSRGVRLFDLDNPAPDGTSDYSIATGDPASAVVGTFVGSDHVLVVTLPGLRNDDPSLLRQPGAIMPSGARATSLELPQPANAWSALAFSRGQTVSGESRHLDVECPVHDPAGTVAMQAVNGGLAYLSADHTLHVLHGAGAEYRLK